MGSRAHRLQYLPHAGLVAPWHMESSGTRDWTCVPCISRQILNYWTTREILSLLIKRLMKSLLFGPEAFFRLCTLGYMPLKSKQRLWVCVCDSVCVCVFTTELILKPFTEDLLFAGYYGSYSKYIWNIFQGCYNKIPHWVASRIGIYFFIFLETGSPKSRCWRVWSLLRLQMATFLLCPHWPVLCV